jgi:hypothetical protein
MLEAESAIFWQFLEFVCKRTQEDKRADEKRSFKKKSVLPKISPRFALTARLSSTGEF